MSKYIELAKKLKALADRGIGGEKLNAQKMLDDLLKKHSLNIEEIEGEKIENHFFNVTTDQERKLLSQISKCIKRDLLMYGPISKAKVKKYFTGNYYIKTTLSNYIEIEAKFNFYKKLYQEEHAIFWRAFLDANDLLIPASLEESIEEESEEEKERLRRAAMMAANIKRGNFLKQLKKH